MFSQGKQSGSGSSRQKRKAISTLTSRWTNKQIPYRMELSTFSSRDQTEIRSAMREWEENTCISFRPATSRDANFVNFEDGKGCSSFVGMVQGKLPITLASGCRYKGVIAHEIGHAVGFFHEQNRPDRDEHIIILKENIAHPDLYHNFDKYPASAVSTYGVPYDYLSIMHYGGQAFSDNGQYTIKTKDPKYQSLIGNREGLSFKDIKLANLMYKCNEKCDSSIPCPREGFVGKDCKCWCPGNPVKMCDGTESKITTKTPPRRTTPRPTGRPTKGTCRDINSHCPSWAKSGFCRSSSYVRMFCKSSCSLCGKSYTPEPVCKDVRVYCSQWSRRGYCSGIYSAFMSEKCPKACGLCQETHVHMGRKDQETGVSSGGQDQMGVKENRVDVVENNAVTCIYSLIVTVLCGFLSVAL